MSDRIPGTRVPDTSIHRASLWLERLKFGGRDADGVEPIEPELWERFVREVDAPFTAEQMQEAANYYGVNMRRMTVGDRVQFAIATEDRLLDSDAVFVSLWLDAFMHGAATMAGKTADSGHD